MTPQIPADLARHVRAFLCLAVGQPGARGALSCALRPRGVATGCAGIQFYTYIGVKMLKSMDKID